MNQALSFEPFYWWVLLNKVWRTPKQDQFPFAHRNRPNPSPLSRKVQAAAIQDDLGQGFGNPF
jgi:hypothetical protein